MIPVIDLYELLENVKEENRNQVSATCPWCGKEAGHFFIKKKTDERDKRGNNKSYQFRCLKCDETGGIYKLLKHLDRLDLVNGFKSTSIFNQEKIEILLSNLTKTGLHFEENVINLPNKQLPLGFKRIYSDEYLECRGITSEDFEKYTFGVTSLLGKFKNRIILAVEEGGDCKGYIARSKISKEEVRRLKEKGIHHIRYVNSEDTEFGSMLFGYDEIIPGLTKTVIAVEGAFDKFNITSLLQLYNNDFLKCVGCWGKKISDVQIYKLQQKGVENVILMFDPDAFKESMKYSYELNKYFNVLVARLTECDPGDILLSDLMKVLDNLRTPMEFSLGQMDSIKLK
jgi:DNA primase